MLINPHSYKQNTSIRVEQGKIEVTVGGETDSRGDRIDVSFPDNLWFRLVHHKLGNQYELQIINPPVLKSELEQFRKRLRDKGGWTDEDFKRQKERLVTLYECPLKEE